MPSVALLNQAGEKLKDIELDASIFGVEQNNQVFYDVINAQRAALRQGTHKTKTRTEVRGGGRKPWRQKGTGRARQGSIRSPQWRGGGTVFGPTPRSYEVKVNRKVRQLGMKLALTQKLNRKELIVLDKIELSEAKTKKFVEVLKALNLNESKALFVLPEVSDNVSIASKNVENTSVLAANHASILDIATFKQLVVTLDTVKYYEEVLK